MTSPLSPERREELAAEYALGVLAGNDLRDARALASSDIAFRDLVARWAGRLAPMLEEVGSVEPPADVWTSILRRLPSEESGSNVIALRGRVRTWRAATAGISAIAASLALILVTRPPARPVPPNAAEAPMVAMLGAETAGAKVMASWSPRDRTLVVIASADMPLDRAHSHEMWVIPAGGKPRSLGTMPSGRHMVMRVPEQLSSEFQNGATLAVSLEPAGGSPTGAPTGPVLVAGPLEKA